MQSKQALTLSRSTLQKTDHYSMIRRARISMVIAVIAAFFGFTGILQAAAPLAQLTFFALAGFSFLSILFALFEDEPVASKPRLAPDELLTPLRQAELPLEDFARVAP